MGLLDFIKKKIDDKLQEQQQNQERLLRWQRLVMQDSTGKLVASEQQLKAITLQQMQNDLRIVKDCLKLVNSTLKPDVFFMRLNLMIEKSKHLVNLEEYVTFPDASFAAAYNDAVNDYHKAINQFLIRYFSDTFDKAEAMKTEKGRIGKYQKFYDSLQEYYCYMNDENIDYIETKYKAYTKH